jgi:hypothetical protein
VTRKHWPCHCCSIFVSGQGTSDPADTPGEGKNKQWMAKKKPVEKHHFSQVNLSTRDEENRSWTHN